MSAETMPRMAFSIGGVIVSYRRSLLHPFENLGQEPCVFHEACRPQRLFFGRTRGSM
jgi:hypothetical protein